MKFTVKGYEIEVKAKRKGDKRASENATIHFMNEVSIWLDDCAKLYEKRNAMNPKPYYTGEHGVIAQFRKASSEVFHQLKDLGAYDND